MRRSIHSQPYVALREALKAGRKDAKLNQQQLADLMERPQSYVAKYETGDRRLDVVEFLDVCSALKLSPEELLRRVAAQL